jgi:hypothetical protein
MTQIAQPPLSPASVVPRAAPISARAPCPGSGPASQRTAAGQQP